MSKGENKMLNELTNILDVIILIFGVTNCGYSLKNSNNSAFLGWLVATMMALKIILMK